MSQETTKALNVVQEMLTAFGKGDMEALQKTLSDDTIWIYHGTDGIPYNGTYKGKEGAVKFITNIVSNVDVLDFQVTKIVADQNTVIVLGSEKQKIKSNGEVLEHFHYNYFKNEINSKSIHNINNAWQLRLPSSKK